LAFEKLSIFGKSGNLMTLPRRYPVSLFIVLALALVITECLVVHSQTFAQKSNPVSLGVTVDVVLGLPLLYYWLIVRTGRWSKTSVVAVFGASLGLAKWLLPPANQTYINSLTMVLPLLEMGVLAYVAYHGLALVRAFRGHRQTQPDFILNLQQSLTNVTGQPKISRILATEAAVIRYGLFGWIKEYSPVCVLTDRRTYLTSHRESGQVALLTMLGIVAVIESVAMHVLVARWSVEGAWLLTATSLYGLLFIIAEIVTTVKRPSYRTGQTLHLRFGLRWQGTVELTNIEQVERINEKPKKAPHTLIGPLLVEPNLLITLREPVVIDGVYGLKKTVNQVAMLVDFCHSDEGGILKQVDKKQEKIKVPPSSE
jgi:hypothetical protein